MTSGFSVMETDCAAILPAAVAATHSHVPPLPAPPLTNQRSDVGSGDTGRVGGAWSFSPLTEQPPLEISEAVYPQFCLSQTRLATFSTWPLTEYFHPDHLVPQGFYYAGYADCIRCFYCGVGLKSWAANDDVMLEHIQWRPSCGYILNTRGRQFVNSMLSRLQEEDHGHMGNRSADWRAGEGDRGSDSSGEETTRTMEEMRRRMEEMGFTDTSVTKAVQHLQQSGVSTIDEDAVIEVILEQQSRDSTTVGDSADNSENTARAQDGFHTDDAEGHSPWGRAAERAQHLRVENERMRAARTCRLCHTERVGLIFLPCGHLLTCERCGSHSTQCPGCDQHVTATAKVYLT